LNSLSKKLIHLNFWRESDLAIDGFPE